MNPIKRIEGLLVVDKPLGPTSHDVVEEVRRTFGVKAGHTGTLDPLASGVLVVLMGRATRLAKFYVGLEKEYRAEISLGKETDTYDAEGEVIRVCPVPALEEAEVKGYLAHFTGTFQQIPPIYSAVKVDGQPLYRWARRNEKKHRAARAVTVHAFDLMELHTDRLAVRIRCSAGTYVRSLAHELGVTLGCGAHLSALRRTRVGDLSVEEAVDLAQLEEAWQKSFHAIDRLLPEFPAVILEEEEAKRARNGNPVRRQLEAESQFVRLFEGPRLLAVAELRGDEIQPRVVLT